MKKLILPLVLILLFISNSKAQTWTKLFSKQQADVFRCVREVPGVVGGYVCAGNTDDLNGNDSDGFVVRLNPAGDTLWTFTYNGPMGKKDLFYKVIPTSDGGFAVCGYTSSVTGLSDDMVYLKLNSSGQQQWVKFYGGSGKDRAQDIIQLPDNSFAIVGYTTTPPAQYYDALLLRTNSVGDTLWSKRYGGSQYDDFNSIKLLADGGFVMGGQSNNGANGLDQYLVRTNPTGTALWTQKFGTLNTDNIECIALVPGGGFALAGTTNSGISDDGYLAFADTGGGFLRASVFGGSYPDDLHRVEPTSDGGYILAGTSSSALPKFPTDTVHAPDMWLIKTNANGDSLWSRTFGLVHHTHGYSAEQTSDGGYIIAGHTGCFGRNYEDAWVIKVDANGINSNPLIYTAGYSLLAPTITTCGNGNTQVQVQIANWGEDTVTGIPVTVQVSGGLTATLNQTYSGSLGPFDVVQNYATVTFGTTINTTAGGTYTFTVSTGNNNDVYPKHNSISTTITIDPVTAPPTNTGNARCGPGSVLLSASAASTIYWYTSPTGGTPLTTGTTYNTSSLTSTTTYYTQTGQNCPSARIPVVATINPASVVPVTTGDDRCGFGFVTLTAASSDPITWYDAPTGGNIVGTGTSFSTPSLNSTTTYYALANNGSCPSARVPAVATISSAAADPVTTTAHRCGQGTVVLNATSSDSVFWYDAASGGNQVGSGNAFTTPSISTTTTYYAQADNGCTSARVAAIATVDPLAADPLTTAGQNCGPGTVNLGAASGLSIAWFDVPTGGTSIGAGTSFTTPSISTTTNFYVETNNGTCPSNRLPVAAVIIPLPIINLGPDSAFAGSSFILDAGSGFVTYSWSSGETTQTINATNSGTYCATVTDGTGCSNNDCVFLDFTNSVSEIHSDLLSVFPNPSLGKFNIKLSPAISTAKISVVNITGEMIRTFQLNDQLNNVDLTSLSKGIYFLKINAGNKVDVLKITIE